MASQCEIIIETTKKSLAKRLGDKLAKEVWRIEDKYSRYNVNSICSKINQSNGQAVAIDNETYLLLNFADTCYQLSDGLFDITSGVLRRIWRFDCTDNVPTDEQVNDLTAYIGWYKVSYDDQTITLPESMEIDFGGIGKEYAVDRCILLSQAITDKPVLVNLGGDLCATSPRKNNQAWQVGIENPDFQAHKEQNQQMIVSLTQGALATSGDAQRYLLKDGKRYSHILNAKTGWPIEHAPRSITVVAPQCVQAGILATLALLQGENAEEFLAEQGIKFWALR
ncbi:MAG: FAD:protein FMN transferase [Colwellia sp.]|nr:FAD:protein FMN transferase [Colwellia sp.]